MVASSLVARRVVIAGTGTALDGYAGTVTAARADGTVEVDLDEPVAEDGLAVVAGVDVVWCHPRELELDGRG